VTEPLNTISELLQHGRELLSQAQQEDFHLAAEVLLAASLEKNRSHLLAWPERTVNTEQAALYRNFLQRRLKGEPIAYITGQREFWSLPFRVTPDTLIPRPETELLVEKALELAPPGAELNIADLGTGSGAIAVIMSRERPRCHIYATDHSAATLEIARENSRRLNAKKIRFQQGDWCRALPAEVRFDLILSNPPYVAEHDPHLKQDGLPWEPASALVSGSDGLDDIRRIAHEAPSHLVTGGSLLLEHGYDQGDAVRRILRGQGFSEVNTLADLAGNDRLTIGVFNH
jgi:release factor glutamine methyltransferase